MKLNIFPSFLFLTLVFAFSAQAQNLTWKAVFISGDDSIANFDNSRSVLTELLSRSSRVESLQFSSSRSVVSQNPNIFPATIQNINTAFSKLNVGANQGCFVHMSSHGAKHQGFYLSLSGILTPYVFTQMVNKACGNAPTIILVSACYSGQFITDAIKGSNRIIMTAAIEDRPSFGCSADTKYTFWDGCLIEEWNRSQTWVGLEQNVRACITKRENELGARPSLPQAYFGENTKNWKIVR